MRFFFVFLIVDCYLDMTRFQKSYKQYEESIKTLLAFRGSIGALISFPIICSWSLNSIPLQLLQMYKHDRIISLVTQIPFDLNRPNFFHTTKSENIVVGNEQRKKYYKFSPPFAALLLPLPY